MRAWLLGVGVLAAVSLQGSHAGSSYECPKKFELHGETCYQYVDRCRTQEQALRDCKKLGAEMVVPESESEGLLLDELASGSRARFLVNIIFKTKKKEWRKASDNTVLPWTHWKFNDAYNKKRAMDYKFYCVMQKKKKGRSKWLITHCNMILPFFCKVAATPKD